ncbi:MAG: hypothetical protein JXR52_03195 [Bacteroidales bacterium]|nr:hypothetical protein [Bacteroidales bacterium]
MKLTFQSLKPVFRSLYKGVCLTMRHPPTAETGFPIAETGLPTTEPGLPIAVQGGVPDNASPSDHNTRGADDNASPSNRWNQLSDC